MLASQLPSEHLSVPVASTRRNPSLSSVPVKVSRCARIPSWVDTSVRARARSMPIIFGESGETDEEVRLTVRIALVIEDALPGTVGMLSVTTS